MRYGLGADAVTPEPLITPVVATLAPSTQEPFADGSYVPQAPSSIAVSSPAGSMPGETQPSPVATPGQIATDSQATGAGFPAVGELASTGDLQVVVQTGSGFALQDAGTIPPSVLTSLGISLSDSQNLNQAQVQAVLNAVALAATTSTAAVASACVVGDATLALFGDTSCFSIGSFSIGTTTALVAAAALVALLMFGGKR